MGASNQSYSPYFKDENQQSLGLSDLFDTPKPQGNDTQLKIAKTPKETLVAAAALISNISEANYGELEQENGLLSTQDVTKREIS